MPGELNARDVDDLTEVDPVEERLIRVNALFCTTTRDLRVGED